MLDEKCIWITRPAGQTESLVRSLTASGAVVRELPMLAIEPLALSGKNKTTVLNLDQYAFLFFISTNAATLGMELIHTYWPQFPLNVSIYAVGPTTADVIQKYDLQVQYPAQRMNTEALLALDSLRDVAGKQVLIVRGVGGRELLASALRERGALVEYLELYQRTCPSYAKGELQQYYKQQTPAGIVVSSAEALCNFADLLKQDEIPANTVPLFVSSERIADIASGKGFTQTITMSGADDKAIIESLQNYFN